RLLGGKGRPGARYNLFDISGSPRAWRCRRQQFGYADGDDKITQLDDRLVAIPGQSAADE
ncbi:MAG: metallophosphoesterase, partial [Pseudomonadota bacterium]